MKEFSEDGKPFEIILLSGITSINLEEVDIRDASIPREWVVGTHRCAYRLMSLGNPEGHVGHWFHIKFPDSAQKHGLFYDGEKYVVGFAFKGYIFVYTDFTLLNRKEDLNRIIESHPSVNSIDALKEQREL